MIDVVNMYSYDQKKSLNGTLVIDSPFQTLALDLLLNFSTIALQLNAPEMLCKSRISLFNVQLSRFIRRMTHNQR